MSFSQGFNGEIERKSVMGERAQINLGELPENHQIFVTVKTEYSEMKPLCETRKRLFDVAEGF